MLTKCRPAWSAPSNVITATVAAGMLVFGHHAMAQQVLRVGTADGGNPFARYDEAARRGTGAGAEIMEAIAEGAGLAIEWVPLSGPGGSNPVAAAIAAGEIDLFVYPFQMTEARKAQFDFTDPIYNYGETLAIRGDDQREYRSAADLSGRSVAAVAGSNFVDIANGVGADTRVVDSLDAGLAGVSDGTIDTVMATAPTIIYLIGEGNYADLIIAPNYSSVAPLPGGFPVEKENPELLAKLNEGITRLMADGTVQEISDRWGVGTIVAE